MLVHVNIHSKKKRRRPCNTKMEQVQQAKSLQCLFGDSAVSLYSSEILGCVELVIYGGKRSNIYSRLSAKALWASYLKGWLCFGENGCACVRVSLTGLNG